jgi:hypothetical protein
MTLTVKNKLTEFRIHTHKSKKEKIIKPETNNGEFPSGKQLGHGVRNGAQAKWNNREDRELTTAGWKWGPRDLPNYISRIEIDCFYYSRRESIDK